MRADSAQVKNRGFSLKDTTVSELHFYTRSSKAVAIHGNCSDNIKVQYHVHMEQVLKVHSGPPTVVAIVCAGAVRRAAAGTVVSAPGLVRW